VIEAALASAYPADRIRERCTVPFVVAKITVEEIRAQSAHRDLLEILVEAEAAAVSAEVEPVTRSEPAPDTDEETHEVPSATGLSHAVTENTLRVEAGRIDAVMNLVGELMIGKSMLHRAISEFERRFSKD